jgi:hypothetical protein
VLCEAPRKVRVAVVDVVVVIISSSDQWALPHHSDGVGSSARLNHVKIATSRRWFYSSEVLKVKNEKVLEYELTSASRVCILQLVPIVTIDTRTLFAVGRCTDTVCRT